MHLMRERIVQDNLQIINDSTHESWAKQVLGRASTIDLRDGCLGRHCDSCCG